MNKPKVSVCMITYNHEKFIQEAIEGVLMQECDFKVELIIANDCSTDSTDNIIQNILKNHLRANWIKYIKHEKNLGMMPNFIFAMQQCKGEYIALCDGDDYWTDSLKLQKQVAFLEENKDYVACFNNADVISSEGAFLSMYHSLVEDKIFPIEKMLLLGGSTFPTSSFFFRNCIGSYPDFIFSSNAGDTSILLLLFDKGLIIYKNYGGSIYRKHNSGIYSGHFSMDRFNDMKNSIILYKKFNKFYKGKYNNEISNAIQKQLNVIFNSVGFFNFKNFELIKYLSLKDILNVIVIKINNKLKFNNANQSR